jgi:hypothetical protein
MLISRWIDEVREGCSCRMHEIHMINVSCTKIDREVSDDLIIWVAVKVNREREWWGTDASRVASCREPLYANVWKARRAGLSFFTSSHQRTFLPHHTTSLAPAIELSGRP